MNIQPQYAELLSKLMHLMQSKICSYISTTRYIDPEWKKEFYELYSNMSLIEHNTSTTRFTNSCKELAHTLMHKPVLPKIRSRSKIQERHNLKTAHKRGSSENKYYNQLMSTVLKKNDRRKPKEDRDFWLADSKIEFLA